MTRLAEVKAERDDKAQRASMLETLLHVVLSESAQHVEYFNDEYGHYAVKAYRLTGCAGGFVVVQFTDDSKAFPTSTQGWIFDDWQSGLQENHSEHTLPLRIAAERIALKRNQLLNT